MNLKKYILLFVLLFVSVILLYYSQNGYDIKDILKLFDNSVYAEEVDLEYKKDESSISTEDGELGNDMVNLLARLINAEARGEPYTGQVAVGAVILNRVKSPKFPNTIAGVIYQNNQFSSIKDGQFNVPIEEGSSVYKAAEDAINGSDPTNGALYFYNPNKTKNKWLFSLKTSIEIGSHRFAFGE